MRGGNNVSTDQGGGGGQKTLLSKEVYSVVHVVVIVGSSPGKPELPGVSTDGIQESLEQGSVGGECSCGICHHCMEGWDGET